jgi:ribosomal protein S18 acetylase RimI-like enzyme
MHAMKALGVRYAVPVDLASVTAVVQSAYRHYIDRIGVRPQPMDVDYTHLMRRGCLFVVGSPAVATVTLIPEDSWLYLDNFAVAPDQQGQGIGRRILAFAEEHARQLWLPEVRLLTNEMMWENQRMYEAAGYVEYQRTHHAPGFDRIHYRKLIGAVDLSAIGYLPPAAGVALSGVTERALSLAAHGRVEESAVAVTVASASASTFAPAPAS